MAMRTGPAHIKRGNLARGLRPWRGVTHIPPNNATCPIRGLHDPEMMAMEYGGRGGEDTDGYRRRQSSRQDGRVQRGRGARSDHENTLLLGGREESKVRLYGERGRGGGRQRDGNH